MYGKINNGRLMVAGTSVTADGRLIINPTAADYANAGFVPIEESEPEAREGYVASPTYTYNKKQSAIVQSWEYAEAPAAEEGEVHNG